MTCVLLLSFFRFFLVRARGAGQILDLGLSEGLAAGDDLLVLTPTNQRVRVAVPSGVKTGQHFRLQVYVALGGTREGGMWREG